MAGSQGTMLGEAIGSDIPLVREFLAHLNFPTMFAAALLVLAVIVVIRIGRALIMAAIFGAVAGGVSYGQGSAPATAGIHAAIGFGLAAATLFLIKSTTSLMRWLLITATGVAALLLWGMGTS